MGSDYKKSTFFQKKKIRISKKKNNNKNLKKNAHPTLDGALEGHGLALLHDAVVRDVVELGAVGAVGAPRAGVRVALACRG